MWFRFVAECFPEFARSLTRNSKGVFVRYYPIFLKLTGGKVVFSGAGDTAASKIKLLLKTEALVEVFGGNPCSDVVRWASENKILLHERPLEPKDVVGAKLVYGANGDLGEDVRAVAMGKAAGALANIVDNLDESDFLTPALVDRDPVTIAIGTEGTAPVLARKIKSDIEAILPTTVGLLATIGNAFRARVAKLPGGRQRRDFWSKYFFTEGPRALGQGGAEKATESLEGLLCETGIGAATNGYVDFIGAGPGDPELLTLKARRKLHEADVVLHDRLVTPQILELARREAIVICVGKKGFGKSWKQDDINALIVKHAKAGANVARLKSGDPAIFGRLDEEIEVLQSEEISWEIVPGITSASAAAACIGASLTKRGRNSSLRFLTGHDVDGFAEQDWASLAKPGATAAIYMGIKASRFLTGRLLMHGAASDTPVTIIENASHIDQRIVATSIGKLAGDIFDNKIEGPAILFLGLSPRKITAQLLDNAAVKTQLKTG